MINNNICKYVYSYIFNKYNYLDILVNILNYLINKYVSIFINPIFIVITLIIISVVIYDLIYNYRKCKFEEYKDIDNNLNNNYYKYNYDLNTIPIDTKTNMSFGCCWRYDSKKRIHGRVFIDDKHIVFYSPISILFEDKEIISKYSVFPGLRLSNTTLIIMEYTKISRMVRRGGSKVLRGSVTIELNTSIENNSRLEIMFCHFLHTKYVYDLLSKLCTLFCSRIYNTIQGDNTLNNYLSIKSDNEKEFSNTNAEKIVDGNNIEIIIPNNINSFPLYELQDKDILNNCEIENSNIMELLNKKLTQEFEEYINEYDINPIPTSSLQNVFPCIIMPIDIRKVFNILSNTSDDNKKNVYLQYLELSGASNIEIEHKPFKCDFMKHIIYKYEKSLSIGGIGLSWLSSKGSISFKCKEDLKLYYLGDDLGILLCIDVNSTGIPENDAFTVNIRHRFTPFKNLNYCFCGIKNKDNCNKYSEPQLNKCYCTSKNYVQLDVECEVNFIRFSLFKIPVIQNTIDQTKKNLDFLRSSWRMHF
ncbi:hypothetical protein FG386_001065 [Cryptosporidium ryanae]|uniref:uncharacterized protein n=1 Tax=Cryptosporidium ryanae TaxID=515981 RepID=UPI00351A5878|nr:hypothetical protein FG386_001065 [Cryptosporidium ryanae]